MTAKTRLKSLTPLIGAFLLCSCADAPTGSPDTSIAPTLKPGNGNGGGGGGGAAAETTLDVIFLAGSDIAGDGGVYDGLLQAGGNMNLVVESPRAVVISDIVAGDGTLIHGGPGPVEAGFFTTICCDYRTMTTIFDNGSSAPPDTVVANPNDFKLYLQWWEGNSQFRLSFGSRKCISGNDPVPWWHPDRGTRLKVTRVPGLGSAAADTTWVVETVGPAAICQRIDNPGRKNDVPTFLLSNDVDVSLRMRLETR